MKLIGGRCVSALPKWMVGRVVGKVSSRRQNCLREIKIRVEIRREGWV